MKKLHAMLGLGELHLGRFPESAANRNRREQLRSTIEQMRMLLIGNTFFAPALSIQAWNSGANSAVIIWTVFMISFSWWLWFSWQRMYETDGNRADMRRFVTETFFNSLGWSVGMALFYPIAEGDQKAIIATIMAGSLALGTMGFSRTPAAGFTYVGVQTICNSMIALVCGIMLGASTDFLLAFLTLAAGIGMANATLERGKASVAAFRDRERLSEKTEVVELLLKDYEEQTTEWLWQTDPDGIVTSAPAQVLRLLGMPSGDLNHTCFLEMIEARCTEESHEDFRRLRSCFGMEAEFHDIRLSVFDTQSQALRWILIKGRPQFERGEFRGFRGIFADATITVEAERRVQFLAKYDSLTELLNRNSVQKRLSELRAGQHFATAFLIDLDGFKQVNDSYGHDVGDSLLRCAAERLREATKNGAWAARLGGDEFFVLLEDSALQKKETVTWLAQDICDRLSQPFVVENFDIQVSASVGIARFPQDTETGTDLLSLSDLALYDAKNNGRNRAQFFHIEMQEKLMRRVAVVERLRRAVRNDEITPFYQSQHALKDGRLIGFEALARWTDDALGFVGPDVFIPIAEQSGLIVEMGEQLLRKACNDALGWASVIVQNPPVVSVNISPVQFARTDVAMLVSKVLIETDLPPELLEIEVTEGVLISDKARVAATLQQLSQMGVSIALDDFGTGYSSLSYLKQLPLNRLKIDRSFVKDLKQDAPTNPIVSTIVQLGHNLGLNVIAEGVEDALQVELLTELGCDDGQGYHYSRPMTAKDTTSFLEHAPGHPFGPRLSRS